MKVERITFGQRPIQFGTKIAMAPFSLEYLKDSRE
jgi:hypothetical protein